MLISSLKIKANTYTQINNVLTLKFDIGQLTLILNLTTHNLFY